MGWEKRYKRKYFYRSRRIAGRSVKEYITADNEISRLLVGNVELERQVAEELRKQERQVEVAKRAQIDQQLTTAISADTTLRTLIEGMLYAVGYHRHNRGEWRKERMFNTMSDLRRQLDEIKDAKEANDARTRPLVNYQAPTNDTEAVELFRKARDGDEQARSDVRKLIVKRGWVEWLGNISNAATNNLIHFAAGQDPVLKAGIMEKVDGLYRQLLGDNPSILEKLLARRIVNNWIATYALELHLTVRPPGNARTKDHLDRALSRAERRMNSSITDLAKVRRLKLPVILQQVNVAEKQLIGNVGVVVGLAGDASAQLSSLNEQSPKAG